MCVVGHQRTSEKPIIYVNHGIANVFEDRIEMNRMLLLPNWEKLHDRILQHERGHKSGGFTWFDFWHDIKGSRDWLMLFKFILSEPSSWRDFNPICKTESGRVIDYSLLLSYILLTIIIGGITWILTTIV